MECFGKLYSSTAEECQRCIASFRCCWKLASSTKSFDTKLSFVLARRKPVQFGRSEDGFRYNSLEQYAWKAMMSIQGQFTRKTLATRVMMHTESAGLKTQSMPDLVREIIEIGMKRGIIKRIKRGTYELL